MNIHDLKVRLRDEGVRDNAYDLTANGFDEGYCLEPMSDGWHYYFRERGNRYDERTFETEDDAVAYFLERVLEDPTTRLRGGAG